MSLQMATCKRRLAALWFGGAATLFLLLIVQSTLGRYADRTSDAWSWFLPTIMPTLSLIIGVLVIDAVGRSVAANADRFLFRLTLGISTCYLLAVLLVIVMQPFSELEPIDLMNQSNLWLGPLQGLVAAALGAFFVKAPESSSSADPQKQD